MMLTLVLVKVTSAWEMTVNAEYDTSKITLKWYVNGVEQVALQNQKTVSFNRTAGVDIYTAKAVDLTGSCYSCR